MIKYIKKEYFANDLSRFAKIKILGDEKNRFSEISNLDYIKNNSLIYVSETKFFELVCKSNASVIIIPYSLKENAEEIIKTDQTKTFILFENPKLLFAYATSLFKKRMPQYGVDKSVITKSFIDEKTVEINSYVTIGENVTIEKDVIIDSFVSIGDNCVIREGTILFSGVKIYENCEIGKNCIIHANTVIGADGFGFVPDKEKYQKIEHLGKVIIEDNVEIGANSCIDRATFGETRIKKGTKIDNLVQIAHNVTIGENSIICAQVGIAGGAKIGNHITFAGQVGVSDHAIVEDNVIAGAQAGLTPKKYEKNSFLLGTPAIDAMKFKKSIVLFSQLPEIVKNLYQIENLIKEIKDKIKD
jgi:UDP-3-O-[3-hydroxymyristoyl] glucosamine N-acyltransferase